MEESQKRTNATSQRYEGLLQVFDSKGKISTSSGRSSGSARTAQSKSVLRFTAPAEVKGVALLVFNHPDRASDQWMWTPAIERDRRIALQDRSTRFFGTDFSFEDLEERDVDQYDYSLHGEEAVDGALCWKIEIDAEEDQDVTVHTVGRLDPQGQLRVRPHRELRQGEPRAAPELLEDRTGVRFLDRARDGDVRPHPRQPHAAHSRQVAVQRAAEGRRLHPAGDPAPVRRLLAVLLMALPQAVAAQTFSQRGFVEGRGWSYPQDAPNDPVNGVADLLVREDLFIKPATWIQFAAGADVRANSHNQVDRTWPVDFDFFDRGRLRPALTVRRLSATLSRGPLTVDVGKQFIRWGKTDIVTPTDWFAPRDFLNVIDNEFLPVSAARLTCTSAVRTRRSRLVAALHPKPAPALRRPLGRDDAGDAHLVVGAWRGLAGHPGAPVGRSRRHLPLATAGRRPVESRRVRVRVPAVGDDGLGNHLPRLDAAVNPALGRIERRASTPS